MGETGQKSSHSEALKSTSIVGGATIFVMVVRMVRTKVLALLLGPAGIGLEGVFASAIDLSKTIVDLGVSSAGVRQIAAAVGSGDNRIVALTVAALRRCCLVLGLIGAGVFFLIRARLSLASFGNESHANDFGWLAIILLWNSLAGGQGALLQGMRRIGDLAKMNALGALTGAALSIPLVYFYGVRGIVPYMIAAAGAAVLVSWLYARKVPVQRIAPTTGELVHETGHLLRLGFVFMSTGMMSTGALFLIRSIVTQQAGLAATGEFQAASALSTVYVGFVLQAMGTDFYPRLTAVASDNARCNQLVNEQAEISILLALPGVLATLAAAPWVIKLFYSGRFTVASDILTWQIVGTYLQVNSWPMGYILVAKGRASAMFWSDLLSYGLYVGLAWLGLRWFGLPGLGLAYLGLYLFHWVLMFVLAKAVSSFSWSGANGRLSLIGAAATALALGARLLAPEPWATAIGGILAVGVGIHCLRTLLRHAGDERITRLATRMRKLLPRL
ncbi:MAG TPA: O-antigen translocase [Candidatus Didemnitutus sp.]|nr:O-antigen translocase [Candidatus Didemnitutus sp.]